MFFETRVQMRLYLADFHGKFPDIRARRPEFEPFHDPASYSPSQALSQALLDAGAGGIIYRSAPHSGSACLAGAERKAERAFRVLLGRAAQAERHALTG